MNLRRSNHLFYRPGQANPGPPFLGAKNLARDRYKKPARLLDNPDVIVIGSGIGGLGMASILAQKKRARVLLLEAQAVPGGCTHCHEIDGFEWNTGIDSVGDMDPGLGRGMFRPTIDFITGGKLMWARMPDVHEVSCFGDDVYEWRSAPDDNIAWLEERFPGDGDVRGYYALEDRIERSVWAWALTKLLPAWVPVGLRDRVWSVSGGAWKTYMNRTTNQVLCDELGFSQRMAGLFSYMYGNHGRTPDRSPFAFHAMNLFHYRTGAYYPVGGPGQIAECVIPIVEGAGGQLAVASPVRRILVKDGVATGVELEDGQTVRAPLIVSDASAKTTYLDLLEPEVSQAYGFPERFQHIRPSPAHCFLFLGYDEEIPLTQAIIWHMPEYGEIDLYDLSTADEEYKGKMRLEGMGGYLLSPSARDPVYRERYPGKTTVIALAECPWPWIERSRKDADFRTEIEARLADNLEKLVFRHMPELRDRAPTVRRAGTSMGCNPRAWEACSLGLEPSGARFDAHTHWLRPQTPIKGLWLTGQDSFSPGFAGSMLSSRVTYAAITGDWLGLLSRSMS